MPDDLRNDQARVTLVIGRHYEPWRVTRAGGLETGFVRRHVVAPVFSFFDVTPIEFPVLFRFIDAREKALALFVLGNMQEKLDDASAVPVQVGFEIANRSVT